MKAGWQNWQPKFYIMLKHKDKVKLARKIRTRGEIKASVPIFQTKAWEERAEGIKKRVEGKIRKTYKRKEFNLQEITRLSQEIVKFIDWWVHTEKTPVPRTEIIKHMKKKGLKEHGVIWALNKILIPKGYIRRAVTTSSNKTFYVQLRRI